MPSSLHQGGEAERDTIAASRVDTSAAEGRRRSESTALGSVSATVIVPFHRGIHHLSACLAAIRVSLPDTPLIVAADGAREPLAPLCAAYDATIVEIPGGPAGPAVARNRAAEHATGDILLFVDADVVVAPDALPGMRTVLESEPHLAAVFGAYDHRRQLRDWCRSSRIWPTRMCTNAGSVRGAPSGRGLARSGARRSWQSAGSTNVSAGRRSRTSTSANGCRRPD